MRPPKEINNYPSAIAQAVERLMRNGVGGPYALALSSRDYTRVVETAEHGGYPLVEHLREILGGPMVWTPGIEGGVVLTLRGGDFLFECGQDISVGYDSPRRRWREPLSGGVVQLPQRDPRGSGSHRAAGLTRFRHRVVSFGCCSVTPEPAR